MDKLAKLAVISLQPVTAGAVSGLPFSCSDLWLKETPKESAVVIFVTRRPGCPWCREQAFDLANSFSNGGINEIFASQVKLFGIVKEVAPVYGAETDEILGFFLYCKAALLLCD